MKMQFKKIVVGIDFSDASLSGARWVANYLGPGAEILLVHVVPLPRPPIYLHEHIGSTIDHRSTLVPRLYTALCGFADLLSAGRVRVGIRTGVPWSALARVASEVKADLICVGRGNKRQGSSRFGATTSQRLLGISPVPVLVIPQGATTRPNRVIAALSGRRGGEGVIPIAKELATAWGSSLDAIHIVEPDVHQLSRMPTGGALRALEWIRPMPEDRGRSIGLDALNEAALRVLARDWVTSEISAAGATESGDPIIAVGDSGQQLVTIAREKPGASVIVMGRVGESLPSPTSGGQYRCGSTTRMVLWAAPGPVFVVPLESGTVRSMPSAMQSRDLDIRVPIRTEGTDQGMRFSRGGWHPNGDDAA
jgi:nucleotide-binding universal stress UspA family protein